MKNMLLEHPLHLEATTSTGNHRVEHFSSHVMKLICFSLLNDPVNLWLPSICELNPQEKTQPAIGYPFAVAYHERHLDISQNQAPWSKWTVNNNHQFRGILVLNWLNKLFAVQLCKKLTHHYYQVYTSRYFRWDNADFIWSDLLKKKFTHTP